MAKVHLTWILITQNFNINTTICFNCCFYSPYSSERGESGSDVSPDPISSVASKFSLDIAKLSTPPELFDCDTRSLN
jgi:hypothetical protein